MYFIGDAAGTIPPITGNGLGLSIRGGILAADFAVKKDWKSFKKIFGESFLALQSFGGRVLHFVALHPLLCNPLVKLCHKYPSLADYLYLATRRKENR